MTVPRRALPAIGLVGFAVGLVYLSAALAESGDTLHSVIEVLNAVVGWSFVGVGLFVWTRRPDNRMGMLLTAVGLAWFVPLFRDADSPVVHTARLLLDDIAIPCAFMLVAFPTGRIVRRLDRGVVAATWVWATVGNVVVLMLSAPGTPPRNLLSVTDAENVHRGAELAHGLAAAALAAAIIAATVVRWRRSTPPERRELAPVIVTGNLAAAGFGVLVMAQTFAVPDWALHTAEIGSLTLVAALAYAFLGGLIRARVIAGRAVSHLVQRLGAPVASGDLRDVLAEALHDPSLEVAFPIDGGGHAVDAQGVDVLLPTGDGRRVTPVERNGRVVAVMIHDPALDRHADLVRSAGAAAALALENARLEAELRAQVAEVSASRVRIITAGDEARRRLERNLHDGAQQRLVSTALRLRTARGHAPTDSEVAPLIDGAMEELDAALAELRELARGIHPAVLTQRGLEPALRSLMARCPIASHLELAVTGRLPGDVEAAVYFVVSEALTNAAKYSGARGVWVRVRATGGDVDVSIADDGVGGADASRGSGLAGLHDRVAALGGRLTLDSRVGDGTTVRASIPADVAQPSVTVDPAGR